MPDTQSKRVEIFPVTPFFQKKNKEESSLQVIPKTELEHFIHQFDLPANKRLFLLRDASNLAGNLLIDNEHSGILCYRKINNVRYLNKFLEDINRALHLGGIYIGCVETNYQLRKRVARKYPALILYPFYFVHFLVKRVLPKWSVSKRLYFFITRGRSRVLSLTEILGRLVSCGFEILEYKEIGLMTYFAVKKVKMPEYDPCPTFGPLVQLKRTGLNGKPIKLYKFRTMHPFAEYLQQYLYEKYGLSNGDKIINDFRVTEWGSVLRKYWIDELPMLINFIKRDIKLVGVRPLSQHKLSLYRKELQDIRKRNKPGLIPPFYVDLPESLDELQDSEYRYLIKYEKNPFKTDIEYFFKAIYNIVIKRARSN